MAIRREGDREISTVLLQANRKKKDVTRREVAKRTRAGLGLGVQVCALQVTDVATRNCVTYSDTLL